MVLDIPVLECSLCTLLAQENPEGKENALYYLTRNLLGPEARYFPIEKICLALIVAIQKLRHYLQYHRSKLISKADHLKYILNQPILNGRLAKWAVLPPTIPY